MAGVDKLIFLFKENEKIDVNNTSVSFVFGDSTPTIPEVPCVINPKIDYSSNTFGSNCGCNYITYDDNVFEQLCIPPDCNTDILFDDTNKTSFTYNCYCDTKKDTNDFLINCSTGGGGSGISVDFGLSINNYGFNSNVTFSLDFYNVESNIGFSSDAVVVAADMRFPNQNEYGFASDTVLYKYTMLDNTFAYGHQANTLISFDNNKFTTDFDFNYGQQVNALVSFDDQNYFSTDINSYASPQSDAIVVFDPYHEFNREITSEYGLAANVLMTFDITNAFVTVDINYGYDANTLISFDNNKFTTNFDFNYGHQVNALVTFDDINKFGSDVDSNYGHESNAVVIYGYPNPFELPFIGSLGYDSTTLMTFGEPNPFPTVISSDYGFNSSFVLNTKLYEDITDFNKTLDVSYGYSANTFVIFNSYNPILKETDTTDSHYGYDASSSMRYSDDPYINNINAQFDYSSDAVLDTQVGLYTFTADFNHGFGYEPNLEYTVGIAATGYYGINSRILYIANLLTPVHFDATMRFGAMMHYNEYDVRNLDLMKKACCGIHKTDLQRIEMMDEPKYSRQYEDVDSFACKVECVLRTEPRFAATITTGMISDIIDPSVYISAEFNYGMTANVRSMNFDSNIDLVGGNFIVDQNEIKVEMTKPDDSPNSMYGMSYGFLSRSDLSTERSYDLTSQQGYISTFDLYYESPLRGNMSHGFQSQAALATFMIFDATMVHGNSLDHKFYEPPNDAYYGFTANVTQLFTENFVEFIEDGELQSEYIHQNKNGDPDLSKPNGISIEGYIYTHYVKGRCY